MFDYIIASNNENKPKERITNMYAKWIYTSVLGNTVVVLAASPTEAPSLCAATLNWTSRKIWKTLPVSSRSTPHAMVTNTSAPKMMTTSIIRPLVWNLSTEDFSDNIIMDAVEGVGGVMCMSLLRGCPKSIWHPRFIRIPIGDWNQISDSTRGYFAFLDTLFFTVTPKIM